MTASTTHSAAPTPAASDGVATPPHLRDPHLADRRTTRGRRPGERRKERAGAQIGDHETARHAIEPAVERFVEVLAGGRGADRRAHHHEHGNRYEGEVVQTG